MSTWGTSLWAFIRRQRTTRMPSTTTRIKLLLVRSESRYKSTKIKSNDSVSLRSCRKWLQSWVNSRRIRNPNFWWLSEISVVLRLILLLMHFGLLTQLLNTDLGDLWITSIANLQNTQKIQLATTSRWGFSLINLHLIIWAWIVSKLRHLLR